MEWPQFFDSLEQFLPQKVPMKGAIKVGAISFFVVLSLGGLFYYSKQEKIALENEKPNIYEVRFGQFLYSVLIISLASFAAKLSFSSKFYSDNLDINGRWMVYKTWGMADKLPIF